MNHNSKRDARQPEALSLPDSLLTDGVVALRPWRETDLPLVEEASRDEGLLEGTTLPRHYSAEEGRAFIERQLSRQTEGEGLSLAIESGGLAVGCATVMLRRPSVGDVGYWLVERARGGGMGSRAVLLLVDWTLKQESVNEVEAFVADNNIASQRLLEKVGFVYVGRQRHQVNDLDEELRVYRKTKAGEAERDG